MSGRRRGSGPVTGRGRVSAGAGRPAGRKRAANHRPRWRLLLFYGLLGYLVVVLGLQQVNLIRLQRQATAVAAEMRAARRQNQALRDQFRMQNSDAYVEKVAREELGLTRQGEILLVPLVPLDKD